MWVEILLLCPGCLPLLVVPAAEELGHLDAAAEEQVADAQDHEQVHVRDEVAA